MFIEQLSIFVENKTGRLAEITSILAKNNINILALSIADTTDFGILRIIVEDSKEAYEALKERGLMVKRTDVVAVSLSHEPGSLAKILKKLDEVGIAIEYMYDFSNRSKDNNPMIILRLSDQEKAVETMLNSGIEILDANIVKSL